MKKKELNPDEQEAVKLILRFGEIDGSHHKQWVLDQVLRILFRQNYKKEMKEFNSDPEYSKWDEGIAP